LGEKSGGVVEAHPIGKIAAGAAPTGRGGHAKF
jgi:hypothetical protein